MEEMRRQLASSPGVDSVEVNPRSGSLLLLGDPEAGLRDAAESVFDLVERAGPEQLPEVAVEDVAVGLVRQLDENIGRRSHGRVSLRWLIPAVFVGFGARQLLRQGFGVGTIPWYVLIYYGVDSFIKMYPEYTHHREGAEPPGTSPPAQS
jgi:hypothetical protein